MTLQEIFDTVKTHLLQQNKRCEPEEGEEGPVCLYRNKRGFRCSIGCLIPDEMYVPEMEGKRSSRLLSEFPEFLARIGVDDLDQKKELLYILQTLHDVDPPYMWKECLSVIARKFRLNP